MIRQLIPMLERTPENYKVTILRLIDSDPEKINFNHVIKAFYMVSILSCLDLHKIFLRKIILFRQLTYVSLQQKKFGLMEVWILSYFY